MLRRFRMREERIAVTVLAPGLRPLLSIAVVAFLVPAVALGVPGPDVSPVDNLESAVLDELNAVRLEQGLRPLRLHARLTAAANSHSLDMVASGYFGHESSDGRSFAARIKGFYKPAPRRAWAVGENLIWQSRRLTARTAVTRWLDSPGHRENLLRPRYRDVGISAVRADRAPGVFGQRRVVVLTVDFGTR